MDFISNFKRAISRKPVTYTRKVDLQGTVNRFSAKKAPQTMNKPRSVRIETSKKPDWDYTGSHIVTKNK